MINKVKVMLDKGAYMPERAHTFDAGMDLRTPVRAVLRAHDSIVIDTGVHIEIPEGYVGELESKSGLNVKHDITGCGTIDSGYTGSIVVKLYNNGGKTHILSKGDKIIQLVIYPVELPELELVKEFEETERGNKGFGSTGV